jgi:heparan-alpha-glucosaminide N-acetyltransferase
VVGVAKGWEHAPIGFAAHWGKNINFAADFDTWFLNLFPRETKFVFNDGGYVTLNFIPTLATMILGLIAANVLRSADADWTKVRWCLVAGTAGIVLGTLIGWLGICPVVKRIWTPTWVLVSGGICLWFLAGFYTVLDWQGWRWWAFPLLVVGTNSIAAYILTEVLREPLRDLFKAHIALVTVPLVGNVYQPLASGAVVFMLLWSMLFWMHRRRIFLRI